MLPVVDDELRLHRDTELADASLGIFIAERINQTLEPGFTGQVYLGRLHNLAGKLAPDIQLHRLEVSV